MSPPDVLCLPVLNIPRREFSYNTETRFILKELNIPESLHVFREEINLYQLNSEGKLSLTLVNSSALTRYHAVYLITRKTSLSSASIDLSLAAIENPVSLHPRLVHMQERKVYHVCLDFSLVSAVRGTLHRTIILKIKNAL